MGVKGLTNYMKSHSASGELLKEFKLYDTNLVIDGANLMNCLYDNNCDYFFGGDYITYSKRVSNFFENLLICGVNPIVLLDGGLHDEKISSFEQDMKKQVQNISNLSRKREPMKSLPKPLLILETFLQVVREKDIKIVQALFDADAETAFLARILDCPVLSCDTDFFIFDGRFIHYETFKGLPQTMNGTTFQLCKDFKINYLIEKFPNIHKETWPLISLFLGNDYVDRSEFEKFTNFVVLVNENNKNVYLPENIEIFLKWLENHSLNSAITEILTVYDKTEHDKKINIVERVVNEYLLLSLTVLEALGYSDSEISDILRNRSDEPYKYRITNNALEELDLDQLSVNENTSCDFLKQKREKIDYIHSATPSWFLKKFHSADLRSSFLNAIAQQPLKSKLQVEDLSYPATIEISFKILKVTFKLINMGTTDSNILTILARGRDNEVETYELDCSDINELPNLESIPKLDARDKKKIFLSTIGVLDKFLVKFPPEWRIFMAAIKYWKKEADNAFTTDSHLYALIFCVIIHVMNRVMNFNSYFGFSVSQSISLKSPLIKRILKKLDKNECLRMNKFVDLHSKVDKRQLNVTVIHAFTLFQNVLKNMIALNVLLQCPLSELKVPEFFDGVIVFNLYCSFNSAKNVKNYIKNKLSTSPCLQQLFDEISDAVESEG